MAGQQHHRRFRAERGEQRADGIGVAGPAGHERDAGFAGQPPVRVGHVDGGGLVADVDEIEAGVERGVEDRHDVVAGEREHALAAEALERLGYDVGAAQRLAHIGFSPRPITGRRLWRQSGPSLPHRSLIANAYHRRNEGLGQVVFWVSTGGLSKGDPYE